MSIIYIYQQIYSTFKQYSYHGNLNHLRKWNCSLYNLEI